MNKKTPNWLQMRQNNILNEEISLQYMKVQKVQNISVWFSPRTLKKDVTLKTAQFSGGVLVV